MGQGKTKLHIITCGLDNSGKTTIINQLKPTHQRVEHISATIGYNVETFEKDKAKFTVFDMCGAKKFRGLWESYYENIDGVIFVIDSTDDLRLCVVKDEIELMLRHADITREIPSGNNNNNNNNSNSISPAVKLPFLFYANKTDLPGAKSPAALVDLLELPALMADRPFNVFASDALRGIGVAEGLEWLQKVLLRQRGAGGGKKKR